jgi:hypothetical protein
MKAIKEEIETKFNEIERLLSDFQGELLRSEDGLWCDNDNDLSFKKCVSNLHKSIENFNDISLLGE